MNEPPNHKTLLIVIVCIIVVTVVAFCVWKSQTSTLIEAAAITVVSPKGGETWVTGSTHTISWATKGLLPTDNVSITIRRIPPPPLQSEGQEFDPIIFTNVPNSGTTEWTIADMYPAGTYVLGLLDSTSTPITSGVSTESAQFKIVQSLSQDLYPLYSKAEWSTPEAEDLVLATTTVSGVGMSSVPVMGTMDPGSVFSPFERYYADKLAALGWKTDKYLEAGGPMGGQTGYRKAGKLIVLRFSTVFHTVTNTAPSECPCDVTLSLFSAD